MRYFDEDTVKIPTAAILGAGLSLGAVALRNKFTGNALQSKGLLMPFTNTKKFVKGIKGRKDLAAVETQKDLTLKKLIEASEAKGIIPKYKAGKVFISNTKKLETMHAAQLKKHNVTDLSQFGEALKGGASSVLATSGGALGGAYAYKKRKKTT